VIQLNLPRELSLLSGPSSALTDDSPGSRQDQTIESGQDDFPRFIPAHDARHLAGTRLQEQAFELSKQLHMIRETPLSLLPWLRGVLVVLPQDSDALALQLLDSGIIVIEATAEQTDQQIADAFASQLVPFQDIPRATPSLAPPDQDLPEDPSGSGKPAGQAGESAFSRTPTYFNPQIYSMWLGKLSEPWDAKDPWITES